MDKKFGSAILIQVLAYGYKPSINLYRDLYAFTDEPHLNMIVLKAIK